MDVDYEQEKYRIIYSHGLWSRVYMGFKWWVNWGSNVGGLLGHNVSITKLFITASQ